MLNYFELDKIKKVEKPDGTFRQSRLIVYKDGYKAKRVASYITPMGKSSMGYEVEYASWDEAQSEEEYWINQ